MEAVWSAVRDALAAGRAGAVATITRARGSTYRREAARMFIPDGGEPVGTISGGCLEGDVVEVARRRRTGSGGEPYLPERGCRVKPMGDTVSRYYVSLKVVDRPGVLAAIADCFGRHGVSIESMIQKGREKDPVDLVFITHEVKEAYLQAALGDIEGLRVVHRIANVIRVEGDR
ncbi:MAG: ACT domain-containing protein [Symbiobacteriaceae bacterium]